LFERCELATSTPRDLSKEAGCRPESAADQFKDDLMAFVKSRQDDKMRFYVADPELDKLVSILKSGNFCVKITFSDPLRNSGAKASFVGIGKGKLILVCFYWGQISITTIFKNWRLFGFC
jgi:hypothetical protein